MIIINQSSFRNNNHTEYESNGDRNKNLSLKEYLDKMKPYLRDIIIDLQESVTWKIQLTIAIKFISSIDAEKEREMYSKNDIIKSASYNLQLLINFLIHLFKDIKAI